MSRLETYEKKNTIILTGTFISCTLMLLKIEIYCRKLIKFSVSELIFILLKKKN